MTYPVKIHRHIQPHTQTSGEGELSEERDFGVFGVLLYSHHLEEFWAEWCSVTIFQMNRWALAAYALAHKLTELGRTEQPASRARETYACRLWRKMANFSNTMVRSNTSTLERKYVMTLGLNPDTMSRTAKNVFSSGTLKIGENSM